MTCPPHHWLIAPPREPTSWGVCKKCGASREFQNVLASWVHTLERDSLSNPLVVTHWDPKRMNPGYHEEVLA